MGWQILNWNKINYSMFTVHWDSIRIQNNWNKPWWVIRWSISLWLNFEIKWTLKWNTLKAIAVLATKIKSNLSLNNCLWLINAHRLYAEAKKRNIGDLVSLGSTRDEIISNLVQLSAQTSKYKVHVGKSTLSKAWTK